MSIVTFYGGALQGHVVKAQRDQEEATLPEHPVLVPHNKGSNESLSSNQAKALRAVTFAGPRFSKAPHLKIEADFIDALKDGKVEPAYRAAIADMLGRAQSIAALPALKEVLSDKEPVEVRIAAVRAIGDVGVSTHDDSYTRADLGEALVALYEKRKAQLNKPVKIDPANPQKASEQKDLLTEELKVIAETLGRLNVDTGRQFLHKEYMGVLDAAENNTYRAQEMMRAMRAAEETFVTDLEKKFDKPFEEIAAELHPGELQKLKSDINVKISDGTSFSLPEAQARVHQLESQHRLANKLISGLLDGLSWMEDNQTNTYLKLALKSSQPSLKAKALDVLAARNELNYVSDIYPNLKHRDPDVRQAAVDAMLYSSDRSARQKVMELLNPQSYFELFGGLSNPMALNNQMEDFQNFIVTVASEGDRYIGRLKKVATDRDFDLQARKFALLTMKLMNTPPLSGHVSARAREEAVETLKAVARDPDAAGPAEKEQLAVQANAMLAGLKDAEAVGRIFGYLTDPYLRLQDADRVALLSEVYESLAEANGDAPLNEDNVQHEIIRLLKQEEGVNHEALEKISKSLNPDFMAKLTSADSLDKLYEHYSNENLDETFLKELRGNLEKFQPTLEKLLEDRDSVEVRMLAARMLGVMESAGSVDRLIEKAREPLKGMVDWSKERSYRGNAANDGANIRLNALMALGQIGKADALDVMTDALDDPTLRRYVPDALKGIAEDANENAHWRKLKTARGKLIGLMENPDVSRLVRAIRLSAGNALFQFKGGVDDLKQFIESTDNPNFKRQAIAALIANDYAVDPKHPDHAIVKALLYPGLGVEKLHARGVTGKGVEMAIVDGGYVDKGNTAEFQDRVKLPPSARNPEHEHPTMVMTTAAGNGKLKGVAPEALVYSDKWPELGGDNPMEVYKKIIEGKLRGENNIRVINNSWGFQQNGVVMFKDVRDILKEFKNVVDMAERAGIQIVFSAGNSGEELGIPGIGTLGLFGLDVDKLTSDDRKILDYILDRVVLVGASNTQGFDNDRSKHTIAPFSSVGDSMDNKMRPTVVAPGVDMMVNSWENGKRPKELVNGTSFSGPYVTGLIALMFQVNPNLKPDQIRSILKSTAVPLEGVPDTYQGAGEVDPQAAIAKAESYGRRKSA